MFADPIYRTFVLAPREMRYLLQKRILLHLHRVPRYHHVLIGGVWHIHPALLFVSRASLLILNVHGSVPDLTTTRHRRSPESHPSPHCHPHAQPAALRLFAAHIALAARSPAVLGAGFDALWPSEEFVSFFSTTTSVVWRAALSITLVSPPAVGINPFCSFPIFFINFLSAMHTGVWSAPLAAAGKLEEGSVLTKGTLFVLLVSIVVPIYDFFI
ncbi:hypothetical protein B0H16DRAFT_1713032 [Mycena metata]|uniref:Uncharacterized protein n=1 Tax=Mycena metata TaxID=1033252 RepID=A0AAD7NUP9_9AGAR|nr:hypothetical protein B0H16DRAFT_1713032 [Mycena metata]